ncbi:MAG: hypothetical protein PHZ19_02780 [Candidatus Thermoplasmatota archaeon]|nr:hypothetical protein [Candidatus Thermoplasmatota archaeon]
MNEPGPVGTIIPDLAYQGGFHVFKRGGESLDEMYEGLGPYLEGSLKARSRIEWVEIDTQLDRVDVARVHFVDPERRVAGYVAELWNSANEGSRILEPWTVKIGYHFLPEETWASFSGIPAIEDTEYPQNGPPEVTIRLFAPGIVMMQRNTSQPPDNKLTRHWNYDPRSVRKALEAMANAYNMELNLGSLSKVVDYVDDLLAYSGNSATEFLEKHLSNGVLARTEEGWTNGTRTLSSYEYENILRDWNLKTTNLAKGISQTTDSWDWQYLVFLQNQLQPIVKLMFPEEYTGGVWDSFWSSIRELGNKIVFGFRTDNGVDQLYFCRLRDLDPRVDDITMFSYQALDHSLLSFRCITNQAKTGANVVSGLAAINALSEEGVDKAGTDKTETEVKTSKDDSENRYTVTDFDENWPTVVKPAGDYGFRLTSATRVRAYEEAAEESVLGSLASNLRGEAELIGAPFLRAGKLIATYGLGVSGESKPSPDEPHRTNVLDRVWVVVGCTHRVDSTGKFTTTVNVSGAGTDDSKKVPEAKQKKLMEMVGSSLDIGIEVEEGKTQTIWEWIKSVGGSIFRREK